MNLSRTLVSAATAAGLLSSLAVPAYAAESAPTVPQSTIGTTSSENRPLNPTVVEHARRQAEASLSPAEAKELAESLPLDGKYIPPYIYRALVALGESLGLPTDNVERLLDYLDEVLSSVFGQNDGETDKPDTDADKPDTDTDKPAPKPEPKPEPEPAPAPAPAPTPKPEPKPELPKPELPKPNPDAVDTWFDSDVPLTATQVVAVEGTNGSNATLRRYERVGGGWLPVGPAISAKVGPHGIGKNYGEGTPMTPAGVFTLNTAFGRAADPGAKVPYTQVDGDDWWVGDSNSPLYNTHQECNPGTCPFDESKSERLASYDVYDYALVMGVNPTRKPGGGSAFFLHETNGAATAGCVAVTTEQIVELVRWADKNTYIALR
ncbi:L,D-transpeptidase family protein [Corynebacterium sp. TAE3-ERU12]|uniref:L,D-transpeptidase family protein n=1 Tax=Corynebacterium sp. TAE3-ERU12 TaxID=2849491 RepID=UPI001C463526|nr:L,D-transpeptidase family protein [Corynebacterium sp. TAE3-ERU12]MBV7295032.1 L,D-transpeptidase family protein [Corynebacterium sp. TAE3-ERU12]